MCFSARSLTCCNTNMNWTTKVILLYTNNPTVVTVNYDKADRLLENPEYYYLHIKNLHPQTLARNID